MTTRTFGLREGGARHGRARHQRLLQLRRLRPQEIRAVANFDEKPGALDGSRLPPVEAGRHEEASANRGHFTPAPSWSCGEG